MDSVFGNRKSLVLLLGTSKLWPSSRSGKVKVKVQAAKSRALCMSRLGH